MASISAILPLCLSLILLFQVSTGQFSFGESSRGFRGDQAWQQQCRFEHLAALEATEQQRSEAGFTEYYNTDARNEFGCAGVNVRRWVVESKGLVLPTYAGAHKLVYIVQGRGVFGMALPGCPETFQSVRSTFEQQVASSQKLMDEHQQIQQFRQGDVIAVPAGVPLWLYNNGDSTVIAFSIIDTGNNANQLDPRTREFFLAGKPRSWQSQQQYSYQAEQQSSNQNIFAGFNPDVLAEALGVSKQTAIRLQGLNDHRGAIIRLEHGLQALQPSYQTEPSREEEQSENALLTPHWTVNAHTVMYVTASQGRIQVVDHHGRSVFDGELHQDQILLVPQNFAVLVKARHEGFAWVSFKTNHNAIDSQIAGKASILRALPVDVVANAYRLSREESRSLKFNRGDEMAVFAPRQEQQSYAE
ncbi:hypothetical protein ABZP36_002650 [Zizania latifolia]